MPEMYALYQSIFRHRYLYVLQGKIFESLRQNQTAFQAVKVDERMGTIVWENGADIDPDVLYHDLKTAWAVEEKELELK